MGDKQYRTPQERDPNGTKRVVAHGDYRRQNLEMKGEDEGRDYATDGGGIPGNSKQGTMKSPPAEGSGKTAKEYGGSGAPGFQSFKGDNQGWPFTLPKGRENATGFNEPE